MLTRSLALALPLLLATSAFAQQTPIQITADLTDAPRKLFHAEIDIPVKPGPFAVTAAAWVPGHPRHQKHRQRHHRTRLHRQRQRDSPGAATTSISTSSTSPSPPASPPCTRTSTTSSTSRPPTRSPCWSGKTSCFTPPASPSARSPSSPRSSCPSAGAWATSLHAISPGDPEHPAGGHVHYAATTVENPRRLAHLHRHQLPRIPPRHRAQTRLPRRLRRQPRRCRTPPQRRRRAPSPRPPRPSPCTAPPTTTPTTSC